MYKTPDFLFSKYAHFLQTYIVVIAVCIVACRVGVFFGARMFLLPKSALLKLQKRGGNGNTLWVTIFTLPNLPLA